MARWDSPLFAISWDDDLKGSQATILDELWLSVTQGAKKAPTAAVVVVRTQGMSVFYSIFAYQYFIAECEATSERTANIEQNDDATC